MYPTRKTQTLITYHGKIPRFYGRSPRPTSTVVLVCRCPIFWYTGRSKKHPLHNLMVQPPARPCGCTTHACQPVFWTENTKHGGRKTDSRIPIHATRDVEIETNKKKKKKTQRAWTPWQTRPKETRERTPLASRRLNTLLALGLQTSFRLGLFWSSGACNFGHTNNPTDTHTAGRTGIMRAGEGMYAHSARQNGLSFARPTAYPPYPAGRKPTLYPLPIAS